MYNSTKYYWCSIGFTLSSFVTLLVDCTWLAVLFIILSVISIVFGLLIEQGEFDED